MSKLTPWFPASVTPVRKGVYEVQDWPDDEGWYAYWNGKRFCYRTCLCEDAKRFNGYSTGLPARTTWRGLANPPESLGN